LAPQWLTLRWTTANPPANGATTRITPTPAPLTATTARSGSTAACSWASVPGTAGDGAADTDTAAAMDLEAATATVVADTATAPAADTERAAATLAEHVDTLVVLVEVTPVAEPAVAMLAAALAADLAAAEPVVDSVVAATQVAVAAVIGKAGNFRI